ncbi:FadR/GntR family transcriptional regulator [Nocardia miyunensis]|uniref:FadR/GntR family transcriptional regulator n=1 Tax=Nocardia miyunensis TaxID=282684 RepID=UPI00082D0A6D|nr:FCD domain-containing protein [Nocardia miyunensis]
MASAVETESADGEPRIETESGGTLAARIAHRIEETVIRRGWPVGETLGSEVGLRERFGVSRSVLREAVRLVEHHQVARMRRGPNGGLFVCAPDAGPATRAIVIYLEYVGTSVADLLEARLLLEPIAAGLAADRITEEGIETLRAILAEEFAGRDDPESSSEDPLHLMLGALSGNAVLRLFIDVLTRLTARYTHTSRKLSRAEVAESKAVRHEEHSAVADAVIAGDGARAQTALAAHLESVAAWIEKYRVPRASRITGAVVEPEAVEGPGAKLAEVLAGRIHEDITERGWQVGMVLGSETDLLTRYGVSRAVLREAVRLLEYHSVARMRRGPGGGLIVAAPEPQASVDTMALYLEYQGVSAADLHTVRNAIELGIVARVTERLTEGDPVAAERLGRAVRRPSEEPSEDPDKGDLFHTELAALAGNPVLSLFLSILTELFRRHAAGHEQPMPDAQAHAHILDAILRGDAGIARHRMRRHLDTLTPGWR